MLPLSGIWPMWKWNLKRVKKAMSLGMVCWAAMSSRSPCLGWVKLGSPRARMTQTAAMVPTPQTASWGPPLFSTSAAKRGWGKYKRKRDILSRPTRPNRKPWCIQICFHKRWFDSVNTVDFPDFIGAGFNQTSLHFTFTASFYTFPQPSHLSQTVHNTWMVIGRPKHCPWLVSLPLHNREESYCLALYHRDVVQIKILIKP